MFEVGQRLGERGRYILEKQLRQGGFGTTFLARDTLMEVHCVVKVLRYERLESLGMSAENVMDLLRREAKRLSHVKHPNIPAFFGLVEVTDKHGKWHGMLSQELIVGKSYREILQERGNIPLQEALQVLTKMLVILEYLHNITDEKGIKTPVLHLDIKPDNIMCRQEDAALFLIDFGLAVQMYSGDSIRGKSSLSLGGSGTPGYIAPEQGKGNPATGSDLYALGITFLELFSGLSAMDLEIALEQGKCFGNLIHLPDDLTQLLTELTEFKPSLRLQDTQKALRTLNNIQNQAGLPTNILHKSQKVPTPELHRPSKRPSNEQDEELNGAIASSKPNVSKEPKPKDNRTVYWPGLVLGVVFAIIWGLWGSDFLSPVKPSKSPTQQTSTNKQQISGIVGFWEQVALCHQRNCDLSQELTIGIARGKKQTKSKHFTNSIPRAIEQGITIQGAKNPKMKIGISYAFRSKLAKLFSTEKEQLKVQCKSGKALWQFVVKAKLTCSTPTAKHCTVVARSKAHYCNKETTKKPTFFPRIYGGSGPSPKLSNSTSPKPYAPPKVRMVYIISQKGEVMQLEDNKWRAFGHGAKRIAANTDRVYVVNVLDDIWEFHNGIWSRVGRRARDIAADGHDAYVVSKKGQVLKYSHRKWYEIGHGARHIAASNGKVYIVNIRGDIWVYDGKNWSRIGAKAVDITAYKDNVYIVHRSGTIKEYNGQKWSDLGRAGQAVAAHQERLYIIDKKGVVWMRQRGKWSKMGGNAVDITAQ